MKTLTDLLERLAVAVNLRRVNLGLKIVLTILFATLVACTLVRALLHYWTQ